MTVPPNPGGGGGGRTPWNSKQKGTYSTTFATNFERTHRHLVCPGSQIVARQPMSDLQLAKKGAGFQANEHKHTQTPTHPHTHTHTHTLVQEQDKSEHPLRVYVQYSSSRASTGLLVPMNSSSDQLGGKPIKSMIVTCCYKARPLSEAEARARTHTYARTHAYQKAYNWIPLQPISLHNTTGAQTDVSRHTGHREYCMPLWIESQSR